MRKITMRILATSMAAMMAISMVGCQVSNKEEEKSTEATTGMPNPVKEVTEQEMIEETGIDLPAPEGAADVTYSVIDGDVKMSQMNFTLDGKKMYLRACTTSETSLNDFADPEADVEDMMESMEKGDISGLNYEWSAEVTQVVNNRDALAHINDDGAGYIAWIDVVPGILYNLCMTEDAKMDELVAYAGKVFVPLQGDVAGDDAEAGDINADLDALIEAVYNTKPGTTGSQERVETASALLIQFVQTYSADVDLQSMEALVSDKLDAMKAQHGDDFAANFQECVDAVVENVMNSNPDYETDVTFDQVVNALTNKLESM